MAKGWRLKLNRKNVVNKTREQVIKNMQTATVFVRDEVKKKLNRGQPTRITPSGGIIGLDPSLPGEPPKKITGQLQNSITTQVVVEGNTVHGLVGSTLEKAAPLEFGNKDGTLKPRPYLRPTIMENRDKINQILAGGTSVL